MHSRVLASTPLRSCLQTHRSKSLVLPPRLQEYMKGEVDPRVTNQLRCLVGAGVFDGCCVFGQF